MFITGKEKSLHMQSQIFCDECGAANVGEATACVACRQPLIVASNALSSVTASRQPQKQMMLQEGVHGPLAPGMLLEKRYHILEQIGAGGFGTVYKARDRREADRLVAVKQIQLTRLSPREMIQATDSYNRETTLQTSLKHKSLPRIYRHFTDPENWYLVMDFIEGETLEEQLKQVAGGKLPLSKVLAIGLQLCDVLRYLHSEGLVFRDVKPANIMYTPRGRVYLIDFGIARRYDPNKVKDTVPLGSPGYAAPEQYGTAQSTQCTDIYGLGATLLTLVTGKDLTECTLIEALSSPDLPATLRAVLTMMLEQDPRQRPARVSLVKRELLRLQAVLPEQRRRNLPRFLLNLLLGSLFNLCYIGQVLLYNAELRSSMDSHGTYANFFLLSTGVQCFNICIPLAFLIVMVIGFFQLWRPGKKWAGIGLIIGAVLSFGLLLALRLWSVG
jgi:serine/threonine protein kinase